MQIFDLFFNGDLFMVRDCCGQWNPYIKWQYQIANLMIFFAYIALPLVLVQFRGTLQKISEDQNLRIFFSLFILSCGLGHIFDGVITFYWTQYHLIAQWHSLTAIVSWLTVGRMIRVGLRDNG